MLCVALDPLSLAGRDLPIAIYEPEVPRVKLPKAIGARSVVSRCVVSIYEPEVRAL